MDRRIKSMVYVIDDDASVRKAFGRLMRSANIRAEIFSSPDEFFRTDRKEGTACILLDISMPGITGFEFMQVMAAEKIDMPVIVVSASDDVRIRERAKELGAVAFFRKPVDDQALLDAIWWAVSGAKERA